MIGVAQDFFVVRFDEALLLAVVDFEAVVFLAPVEREPADFEVVPFDFAFDVVDFDEVLGEFEAVVFVAPARVPLV